MRLEASFESVLEASLLYARIAERQAIEDDMRQCQEKLEKLRKELDQYTSVDPAYAEREGITDMVERGVKSISDELRVFEAHLEQDKVYLARINEDVSVIADGLQRKLEELREVKFAQWLRS